MPRIPVERGIPRGSFAGLLSPRAVTQAHRAGTEVAEQVTQIGLALAKQRDEDETNRGVLSGLQMLGDLEDELTRDNSILPAERIQRYIERSGENIEGLLESASNTRVRERLRIKLGLAAETQLRRMRVDAFQDEKAAGLVTLERLREQYATQAAAAPPGSEARSEAVGAFGDMLAEDQWLWPHEKKAWVDGFGAYVDELEMSRLAKDDPNQVIRRAGQGDWPDMQADRRQTLLIAAQEESERQATRAHTARNNARKEIERNANDELTQRFYDPRHPQGVPSIPEILAYPLPREDIEHWMEVAEKEAEGINFDWRDNALVIGLYERINDRTRPDAFQTMDELTRELNRNLGRGLPLADRNQMIADFERLMDPAEAAKEDLWTRFFAAHKSLITGTTATTRDPEGDAQYYKFYYRAQALRRSLAEQNKDDSELLDPKSPNFLGNLARDYKRSRREIQDSRWHRLSSERPERASGEEPPPLPLELELFTNAQNVPGEPGETPEAYLDRVRP